jgi:predicted unusual protein kinase regulating ubiquinone biosynthesis (AarF/ABC1/UbiB family)
MQKLAFDILSTTKDLPFKLPSEAIYILRTSAIIEGLGTTYIENFNGIKDILPILQENIPKALGSKNFTELMIDTVKDTPFFIQNVQKSMQQISKGEVGVVLSNEQLSWVAKEIKEYIKSKLQGILLIIISFYVLFYDENFRLFSLIIFIIGILAIYFKK